MIEKNIILKISTNNEFQKANFIFNIKKSHL